MIPSNRADASDAASDEIENKFAETALVHLPFGLVFGNLFTPALAVKRIRTEGIGWIEIHNLFPGRIAAATAARRRTTSGGSGGGGRRIDIDRHIR